MLPRELEGWIEQAQALHREIPVFASYFEFYGYDSLFKEGGGVQCDLEKLDAAGIRTFGIAVANGGPAYFQVGPDDFETAGPPEWALENLRCRFDEAMRDIRRCPRVRIVATARDLQPGPPGGAIGLIPLITCHSYMVTLDVIDEFFHKGLRISHPAGSTCTLWCRAVPGARVHGRRAPVFNEYGRQVVARMNELGIVIDLAHMTDESAIEIIKASHKPVIDGHTSSRDAVPYCRGHSDAVLRLIADSGGVAGIHFADHMYSLKVWGPKYEIRTDREKTPGREPRQWAYNRYLLATVKDPYERARLRKNRAAQEKFYREHDLPPDPQPPRAEDRIATLADMADHIEHMINVMGVEHVGLGGDVNGITPHSWPLGMDHVGELPHLTAELLRRGHTEGELRKFLCDNWRRVFAECLPP